MKRTTSKVLASAQALQESEERYRLLLESISDSIYVLDREWRHIVVNEAASRFAQIPKAKLLGAKLTDLFPSIADTAFFKTFQRVRETRQPDTIAEEYTFADGQKRWYEARVYPVPEGILCISRDITERKRAEEEIKRRSEQLAALNAISATVSSSLNLQEILDRVLDKVLEVTGVEVGYMYLLEQRTEELVLATYRGVAEEFADQVRTFKMGESLSEQAVQSGEPIVVNDLIKDSRVMTTLMSGEGICSLAAVPMKSREKVQGVMYIASRKHHPFSSEEMQLYIAIANQIGMAIENARLYEQVQQVADLRKWAEEKLWYLSSHDALTGLYNRTYFDGEMARLERGRQFPVSIVIADVDGLKATNDSQGHAAGDELLRRAAEVLREAFRAEDVIARTGGDEFAVLMPGTDASAAEKASARVRENVTTHNRHHPQCPLSLSVGVATGDKGCSLAGILKEADKCMYQEKLLKTNNAQVSEHRARQEVLDLGPAQP